MSKKISKLYNQKMSDFPKTEVDKAVDYYSEIIDDKKESSILFVVLLILIGATILLFILLSKSVKRYLNLIWNILGGLNLFFYKGDATWIKVSFL